MIQYSTHFIEHLLTRCRQISYTSLVLETSILPPPSDFFQNVSTPFQQHQLFHHAAHRP